MFYRDYMQKFRPLYAPDGPSSDAPAAGGEGAAAAASGATADAGAGATAAPAADTSQAAAAPETSGAQSGEPSLLEQATSAAPAEQGAAQADSPAPAEAADGTAKPEGDKPDGADVKDKGEADKPKPDSDKQPEADPAKTDATANEPPAPIKYDAFTLPEGIKLDDERLGKFTEVAGQGQVSQAVAQSLLDLHVQEMQRFAEQVQQQATQHQHDVWRQLNDGWKADFRNDPELGGNREQTSLAKAKAVLEEYGGTKEQVAELLAHTRANGMGNYPGFLRLLVNIADTLNVYEDTDQPANPSAPRMPQDRASKWYPSMNNGSGNGAT